MDMKATDVGRKDALLVIGNFDWCGSYILAIFSLSLVLKA